MALQGCWTSDSISIISLNSGHYTEQKMGQGVEVRSEDHTPEKCHLPHKAAWGWS